MNSRDQLIADQVIASESSRTSRHSSASNEHATPVEIVEAAREVMGGIDLDPASCKLANTRVKATVWFGDRVGFDPVDLMHSVPRGERDALRVPWNVVQNTRVFLNPPGGRLDPKTLEPVLHGGTSSAKLWWKKLAREWEIGNVSQAIFVGFSIEILQSTQDGDGLPALAFPFCVPSKRIKFDAMVRGKFVTGSCPTHANVIVHLPPKNDYASTVNVFDHVFSKFGRVVVP